MKRLSLSFLFVGLCACVSHPPAPVVNAWLQPQAQAADYVVSKGDTIYSIAWQFGLDYHTLARANHLRNPYPIRQGQHLKMTHTPRGAVPMPVAPQLTKKTLHNTPTPVPVKPAAIETASKHSWQWPAIGKLVRGYSPTLTGNAGINIAGRAGSPIRASLSGEVVYCGNGIRGYGHLIIIKHNSHFLSAYADNQQVNAQLGQKVRTGQQIATMGRDESAQPMLHFEIRYDGRPVDPLHFLR